MSVGPYVFSKKQKSEDAWVPLYAPHDSKKTSYRFSPSPSRSRAVAAAPPVPPTAAWARVVQRGGLSRHHLQDPPGLPPRRRPPLLRRRASLRQALPRHDLAAARHCRTDKQPPPAIAAPDTPPFFPTSTSTRSERYVFYRNHLSPTEFVD